MPTRAHAGAVEWLLAGGTGLLTVAGMAALLWGSWAAFTNHKFTLTDYGKYVNMLWNTAHGRPFQVLTDYSYLQTHLSFTLAPLGLLFYGWDHPFLLAVVQWTVVAAGAGVLVSTARRLGCGPVECAALALFLLVHPYTQAVLLSEFHGVSLYYLLVPWLLHALLFRRGRAWVPLVLLLGLREDAAFVVVPLLLYVAATEGWRAGYLWALVALLYGLSATTWLFQALSGTAVTARRDGLGPGAVLRSLRQDPWLPRLGAACWLVLPAVPYLVRGWRPLLVVPSVAAAIVLLSPFTAQHTMSYHYPAASMALTAAALVLAARRAEARRLPLAAVGLVGLTLVAHLTIGFAPGGGRTATVYREPRPIGLAALRAARALPKEGLLVTDEDLAVFAANRADLLPWRLFDPARHRAHVYFFTLDELERPLQGPILARALERGEVGVTYFDGWFAIAQAGASPTANAAVRAGARARGRTIVFAFTRRQAGTEPLVDGGFLARYWPGDPRQTPLIALGGAVRLDAGRYRAMLRYRTGRAPESHRGYGILRVYREGDPEPVVQAPLAAAEGTAFREQTFAVELAQASRVEARVSGGAAPVWLDRLVFEPAG